MPDPKTPDLALRFGLHSRVAAVTGASRGIGAAIAAGLADAGARVFGLSRSATAPVEVEAIPCDVSDAVGVQAAFDAIATKAGTLHILVNAAGISLPPSAADFDGGLRRFRQTLDVDLVGAYATIVAALPLMRRAGGGVIINLTSINSQRGFPNNPGYVAAKAGLAGLTRALAVDLSADRIRVNALAPGYVRTAMTDASYRDPVLNANRSAHTIVGRWGEPDDLVGAAIFLASDASAYITGQEIFVDGGWTAKGLNA